MFQSELINSFQLNAERIAIEYNGQETSYAQLFAEANQITRYLGQQSLAPETIVGIDLADKVAQIAAMIGIMNARCAFVMLDRSLPAKRLQAMVEDMDLQYVLTDSAKAQDSYLNDVAKVWEIKQVLNSDRSVELPAYPASDPEDSIYVYFTSGSTGKPKGIVGKNKSLLQFIQWEIAEFEMDANTRVSQFVSPFFDAFLRDVFAPLLAGGTICIPPEEDDFFSPEKLISWIDATAVNMIHCVPSLFQIINDESLQSTHFPALRYILMSGERIVPASLKPWYQTFGDRIQLMNLYGLTETTMIRSAYAIQSTDVSKTRIPVGTPIADTTFLIAKKGFKPCNTLIPGELYIISDYLSKGYLNNPELTAEKFIQIPGYETLAVRTGDKARRLPDGTIELIGREDRQIKLNGIRIELDEIESVLANSGWAKEQYVMIHQDDAGNESLLAFVTKKDDTAEEGFLKDGITAHLKENLPTYMIPADVIVMEAFPLLPNGKLDQKKLLLALNTDKELRLPENELETQLLGIWQAILKTENLSTDDVFYQVGGTSLGMIRLIGKINKAFQIKIKINELFNNPTIVQQAAFIAQAKNADQTASEGIRPAPKAEHYALSPTQRQLYFIQAFDPKTVAYNLPQLFVLEGALDHDFLQTAIQQLVDRHESFRTSFALIDEEPRQVVHPEVKLEIEHFQSREADAKTVFRRFVRPFELEKPSLLRVGVNQVAKQKAVLMIDMHHIVSDAISEGVFLKELVELFNGRELPLLPIQPKDYATWLQSPEQQQNAEKQKAFWNDQFLEAPKQLELPTDFYRPSVMEFRGDKLRFDFDQQTTAKLQKICDQEGVTLYILLLSIFNVLLGKMANQEDVTVGTAISGRKHADLETLIGLFVNIIPLRNYPQPNLTFKHFLSKVKSNTIASFDHQEYPFESLIKDLGLTRSPDRNPLFDVMFEFLGAGTDNMEIPGLEISGFPEEANFISRFDLTLMVREHSDGLSLEFEYSTALFKRETIARLTQYFERITQSVLTDLSRPLSQIELLDEAEKQTLLVDFNQTEKAYPETQTFTELFQQQVAQTPGEMAVSHGEHQLSYQELSERATELATYLQNQGIGKNDRVVLCMPRGIEMLTSILAVFQAGAAYLPIDVSYPDERIREIIADSEPAMVLTTEAVQEKLENSTQDTTAPLFAVNLTQIPTSSAPFQAVAYDVNDLAYIIYTSGSTGKPKGVMIHQQGMVNHLYAKINDLQLESGDVIGQTASPGFDISVWQFLIGLLIGGRTHIIDKAQIVQPERLVQALKDGSVTVFESVPSLMTVFLDSLEPSQYAVLQGLKWMIATGEPLGANLVHKWYAMFPEVPLLNAYGPTEASDDITHHVVATTDQEGVIPIGKPVQNMQIYILDKQLNLCPVGVTGEICVAGVGVGQGYWKNEAKTQAAFVPNPFPVPGTNETYETIYKTGDLGYFRADGTIICLGRIDEQVKIQGNRIELGEIEDRLEKHPLVKEVAVMAKKPRQGSAYLAAYFVAAEPVEDQVLREYLTEQLPAYMVPSYFVEMEVFPLTPNGKLNRKALPEPEVKTGPQYTAPQNEQEALLAEVWAQVLGMEQVGTTDNFFSLGGDSIKSIQISSRLRKAGYELSIQDIFNAQTIQRLAKRLRQISETVDQSPVTGVVPLTGIQQTFFNGPIQQKHHYNQAVMLNFPEGISEAAVRAIVGHLQTHHDALRLVFRQEEGKVVAHNQGVELPVSISEWDLRSTAEADKLEAYAAQLQQSIDLENGPLLKLGLLHKADGSRLLIVAHHLIMDGVSWRILFEDFETLYAQYQDNETLSLPLKTTSFQAWSQELQRYQKGKQYKKARAYWSKIAYQAQLLSWPVDNPEGSKAASESKVARFALNAKTSQQLLRQANSAFQTQINDLLLAALVMAMHKKYGQSQVFVELEGHGREEIAAGVNISRTVGWFTSAYPVLLKHADGELDQVIKAVKEQLRGVPNNGLDFLLFKQTQHGTVSEALSPQVVFNYLGQFDTDLAGKSFVIAEESTGATVSPTENLEHDWDLSGMITSGQLEMTLKYSGARYQEETIAELMDLYQSSLTELIEFCANYGKTELTPADLTYSEISVEELDELQKQYPVEDLYPLSPMQEGMLFHALMDASSDHYFEQFVLGIKGELDIPAVESSMRQLMAHYDVLRTSFLYEGYDRPLQLVWAERDIDFQFYDLQPECHQQGKEPVQEAYYQKDRARKFNLSEDALLRLTVLQTGPQEYDMIWSFHHILMDGWCLRLIFNDFKAYYNQQFHGQAIATTEVRPYANYISWLENREKEASADYWKGYLQEYQNLASIPSESWSSSLKKSYQKASHVLRLEPAQIQELNRISEQYGVTVNTILQTAWGILLGRYNDVQDVVFGAVVSGRPAEIEGIETMVGLFINTIPVRIQMEETQTIVDLLKRIQNTALESESHHYHPLSEIQTQTELGRGLLDHIMVFENYPISEELGKSSIDRKENFEITSVSEFEQTNYDLTIEILPGKTFEIWFQYNASVHTTGTIEKVSDHLNTILDKIMENAHIPVGDLEFLSAAEKDEILYQFNDTSHPFPEEETIVDRFEAQVAKTPNNLAVQFGEEKLTFAELNEQADRIASYLNAEMNIGVGDLVGLMVEREAWLLPAIFGILKSGGAYVPISPAYPVERKRTLMLDAGLKAVVSRTEHLGGGEYPETPILNLDEQEETLSQYPITPPKARSVSSDLAYVIYTSGSTGKPKGVMIEHYSVINRIEWMQKDYPISEKDVLLQKTPVFFDVSVWELFWWAFTGSSLYVLPPGHEKEPRRIAEAIDQYNISTIHFVPSMLDAFLSIMGDKFDYEQLSSLRTVFASGEALKTEHVDRFGATIYPVVSTQLVNLYGPTEATVDVTCFECSFEATDQPVPIGKPIDNTQLYILNKKGGLCPVGIKGELVIAGVGLARGYLGNEALTAEKFVHHPGLDKRIYLTGDIARWKHDGNIEFMGRKDNQVKIRGYRIELGEIEHQLGLHPAIEQTAVLARYRDGDPYLVAYFTASESLTNEQVSDHLTELIPSYMVPTHFVQMQAFPLNANGKLDRKALPDPDLTQGDQYVAPTTETEVQLVAIWSEILRIEAERISVNKSFLELGGHSLNAITLSNRVLEKLGVEISLKEIFDLLTVKALAELIEGSTKVAYVGIPKAPDKAYYPLTIAQSPLFFLAQIDPEELANNITTVLKFEGKVDKNQLEQVLKDLIAQHESLRTSFHLVDDTPVQVVEKYVPFSMDYHKVPESEVEGILTKFVRPFDLGVAPLIRATLIEIGPDEYVFAADTHHIMTDGQSNVVLGADFLSLLRGEKLDPVEYRYRDLAEFQQGEFYQAKLAKQKEFWVEDLRREITPLTMPHDYKKPEEYTDRGAFVEMELTEEETAAIKALAKANRTTMATVMLSFYNILLGKLAGQEDIVVGIPLLGREHIEFEEVVGMFVKALPIRLQPQADMTYEEFLETVKTKFQLALENQGYPYETLAGELNVKRETNRNPWYDVMYTYEYYEPYEQEASDLNIAPYFRNDENRGTHAIKNLNLIVTESATKLSVVFSYSPWLFHDRTMEKFMSYLKMIALEAMESPKHRLADFKIIEAEEQQQIFKSFNDTATPIDKERTFLSLFEEQVAKHPDRVALTHQGESRTFQELYDQSLQVAHHLMDQGLKPREHVAIYMPRGVDMLIGILASFHAGCAYVPMDIYHPRERVREILRDCEATFVLTNDASQTEVQETIVLTPNVKAMVNVRTIVNQTEEVPPQTVSRPAEMHDLMYIIYTSGTTGKPKGVMIHQLGMINHLYAKIQDLELTDQDVIAQTASPCFDISVWQFLLGLVTGGRTHIIDKDKLIYPESLVQELNSGAVTVFESVPSLMNNLLEEFADGKDYRLDQLRWMISTGEQLSMSVVKKWYQTFPEITLFNAYGPTEASDDITHHIVPPPKEEDVLVPIGKPVQNMQIYILSEYQTMCPIGVKGEICVAGLGIGKGYWKDPEKTAKAFVPNPFLDEIGDPDYAMLYRTGDIGYYLPDGTVMYNGRKDDQIKIRGNRIELGEIENRLGLYPGLQKVAVVAKGTDLNKYLVAYYAADEEIPAETFHTFLAEQLPDYMIPNFFQKLEDMPLTFNGKLDRKGLPEPDINKDILSIEYTPPETETEQTLVKIWAEVLGLNEGLVGTKANYFLLGGHSLNAISLIGKVHKAFNVKVPLREFFLKPTIHHMAMQIDANLWISKDDNVSTEGKIEVTI